MLTVNSDLEKGIPKKTDTMKKYIIPILLTLAVIAGFWSYHKGYIKGTSKAVETIIERRDTIYQFDTITRLKPVYLTSTVVDSIPYPVPVPGTTDTIYANLPRTEREYGDSTYHAIVSGVEPELKRIDIFQKTQYINNTVYVPTKDTRKDFVELDAKFLYDKMPLAPVTLNVGYIRGPFEVYAGGGYDFMQKAPIVQVGARARLKF